MESFFNSVPDPILIVVGIILSTIQLTIKAIALWRAAKFGQKNWFIALLILLPLRDLGIFGLIYLFRFAKKRLTIEEVKGWFHR